MRSPSLLSFLASVVLIVGLFGGGVVDLDAGFGFQGAKSFVAADDDFVAFLKTLGDFNVGDAGNAGVDRAEDGFLSIDDENTLDLVFFRIAGGGGRRSGQRDAGTRTAFGVLCGFFQIFAGAH